MVKDPTILQHVHLNVQRVQHAALEIKNEEADQRRVREGITVCAWAAQACHLTLFLSLFVFFFFYFYKSAAEEIVEEGDPGTLARCGPAENCCIWPGPALSLSLSETGNRTAAPWCERESTLPRSRTSVCYIHHVYTQVPSMFLRFVGSK